MKKLSLIEVIAMAVGIMIGASIFSIFGIGAQIAGRDLPEAFLLASFYALIVAYSYSKLGAKIVTNSGPIGFILKGMGDNVITGTLSILLWLSYVVCIALFSEGFSGYFLPLLKLESSYINNSIVVAVLILFFVGLNIIGSKAVGKSQVFIVILKIGIIFAFIIGGIWSIQAGNIEPDFNIRDSYGFVSASVIFFLSYMGFGLITNASENLVNPEKNVPRAIFLSILIVLMIYVLISLVTLGNLPISKVIAAKENALAIAAMPFLGHFGFLLVSLGALISIASALNATIFGGANISYSLAKDGELPKIFERRLWFKSQEGLYLTAGLGLVFSLVFDLGAIASITSTVFTTVYIFVIISHIKLRKKYGGNLPLLIFNLAVIIFVLIALLTYQWQSHRSAFYGTIITFTVAFVIEYMYRTIKNRKLTEHHKNHLKNS